MKREDIVERIKKLETGINDRKEFLFQSDPVIQNLVGQLGVYIQFKGEDTDN